VLNEYRRYADYLESVLDQQPIGNIDFRASRPSIPEGLTSIEPQDEFAMDMEEDEASESDDPLLNRRFKGLTVNDSGQADSVVIAHVFQIDEGGNILHHGDTAPFRFRAERSTLPSRFPAILEDPHEMYVLMVDAESEVHYNPHFDWSRHLPSAVPLDRRSHDRYGVSPWICPF
jgi:hypothetical protein